MAQILSILAEEDEDSTNKLYQKFQDFFKGFEKAPFALYGTAIGDGLGFYLFLFIDGVGIIPRTPLGHGGYDPIVDNLFGSDASRQAFRNIGAPNTPLNRMSN
jgi:hypothetical protein